MLDPGSAAKMIGRAAIDSIGPTDGWQGCW